jgi:hypothetical protein
MAVGDLKKVAEYINSTGNQRVAGQIAVWMVTDSAKRDSLEGFGATDSEIEEALDILDDVDVEPPFTEDGDSGLLICLGLVALMIILIAVIAFISFKFKGKPQSPPEEIDDKEETHP